jgi:hypothetical protein
MADIRVLIGSIVHVSPSILRGFLASLAEIKKIGLAVDYLFIADSADEDISRLLAGFSREQGKTGLVKIYDKQHYCQGNDPANTPADEQVWQDAGLKDTLIEQACKENYDYLFLVKADLDLHPNTLAHLVGAGKDIISEVIWPCTRPDTAEAPQVWMQDQNTLYMKKRGEVLTEEEVRHRTEAFLAQLHQPGIYEVGGLSGCILISRQAMDAGVSFARIKNLSFRGEDSHISIRAAAKGFSLFVDTHYPAALIQYTHLEPAAAAVHSGTVRLEEGGLAEEVTISLCMIVKNEESVLARCLSSVQGIADEIIIVDTGSSDRTKEVAGRFTDKVYDFPWIDNFSVARNTSFGLATQKYILWLDADDYLTEKDNRLLLELKRTLDPTVDSVTMDYHLAVDHEGKVLQSIRRHRWYGGPVISGGLERCTSTLL